MSLPGQELKAVVAQILEDAADEIFALFERAFAEFQDELFRSKLMQPRVVLYREDVQAVIVDSGPEPIKIKQEEESSLKITCPSATSEENGRTEEDTAPPAGVKSEDFQTVPVGAEESSTLKILLSSENTGEKVQKSPPQTDPGFTGMKSEGEEPDLSVDFRLEKEQNPTTDKRKCTDKRSTKGEEQKKKAAPSKNSAAKKDGAQRRASFSCSECAATFTQHKTRLRHMRSQHQKERPHKCCHCHKEFFRKYDFELHLMIHTGERPFSCSVCSEGFRYRQSLMDHEIKCLQKQFQSDGRNHPLWGGGVPSSSETQLRHVQTVLVGSEPVKSQKDDSTPKIPLPSVKTKENVSKLSLKDVEDRAQSEDPGLDLDLDKNKEENSSSDTENSSDWESMDQVSTKSNGQELKAENIEGNEKPHQCSQCFKTFESAKNLKKHLKYHEGEGSFSCQICNKVYNHRTSLRKHLRDHQGPSSFTCQVCSKVYSHKSTYTQHLRIHSAHNPFRCSSCPRAFIKSSLLVEHERIHSGEKPFSCSVCSLRFRLRLTRDRHVYNEHHVQKPFRCSLCLKEFSESLRYESHLRIHTGEKPFSCSVCDKSFREKGFLSKHMRFHKTNPEGKELE